MHRILFRIPLPFRPGHFDIASYGVMVAIGALFGVMVGISRAKKAGEKTTNVLDLALYVLIAGLIGARIFYLISDMDWTGERKSLPNIVKVFFQFRQGGLVFYGGFLLAIPAGMIYLRAKKLNVWKYGDIAAPSIALGIAFARIGCYLNGCCFGKPCPVEFPFHVAFPAGSFAAHFYGKADLPLYPTQFIHSINAVILFSVLSVIYYRWKRFDGQVFWLFGMLYAVTRFLIEFLRGDVPRVFLGKFTVSQGVSMLLLPLSVAMFLVLRARGKRATESGTAGK